MNHFWPPHATWQPDRLLESIYGRSVFYAAVVLVALLVAAAVGLAKRLVTRKKRAPARARWRGAAAVGAFAASSAGWFVAGLLRKGKLDLGPLKLDLGEVGPFFAYWAFFLVLGVGLTIVLKRFAAGRRWWRASGKLLMTWGTIGFALAVSSRHVEGAGRPIPRGPNVVMIILDAWRADTFRRNLMPHLYEYARNNALVYSRAWSCAPWTIPSMGAVFTGQHVDSHRARSGPRRDYVSPTLAQVFRAEGYETTAFVSNRLLDRHHRLVDGFDHYVFWDWPPILSAICFFHTNWYGAALREIVHRDAGSQASRALTVLLGRYVARRHRRPYFLWVHYMDPHVPYTPPPGYYEPRDAPFIKEYYPKMKKRRFAHHRLYEGECAYVDDLLAPMVLPTLARDKNTIVVITSDHGEEFLEHGHIDHGKSVYESVTRVPLLISVPGKAPAAVKYPASQVDLAPTILRLAGIAIPKTMQGEPLPMESSAGPAKPVFAGSSFIVTSEFKPDRQDAVIVWPWKLILYHDHMDGPGEFYDLSRDPHERQPLVEDDVAELLRRQLKGWKEAVAERRSPRSLEDYNEAAADLRALGYIQ
ncbi:MAG: sulfatase-like hydrolase/transferase [candidate division Zixibacteria bacterium]|nr:sulfatase-like hydrolase/transferase [candidate division Zixibacteria bacterium]